MNKILSSLDLSKKISRHLVGRNHTPRHHKTVGAFLFMLGLAVIKFSTFGIVAEALGVYLQGIGLIPFTSKIEQA